MIMLPLILLYEKDHYLLLRRWRQTTNSHKCNVLKHLIWPLRFTAKWYPGQDGKPIPKDALRICTEQGLKGIEKIRLDELRALPDFASVKHEIQVKAE